VQLACRPKIFDPKAFILFLPWPRGNSALDPSATNDPRFLSEEIMKLHVILALAGLTIGLAVPALAQQKEPPLGEQDYQKLVELGKKNDEAWSNHDAAALAALYTGDALFVTSSGILSGRDAIEKRYEDDFKDFQKKAVRVTTEASPLRHTLSVTTWRGQSENGPKLLLARPTWSKRSTATPLFWPSVTAIHGSGVC
jgi:uncharacterized protein (TIGR02246 family)